jgi:hypothetical protein
MRKITIIFIIIFLFVFALGAYLIINKENENAPNSSSNVTPTETSIQTSPEQAVQEFYDWYQDYKVNVLTDKAYQTRAELSDYLKSRIEQAVATNQNGGIDPIICAQDIPRDTIVGKATINGKSAVVDIEQTFTTGKRLLPVELTLIDNTWKISTIKCGDIKPQQGLGVMKTVIYFSNSRRAGENNTDCSLVYGVEREIPRTPAVAKASLKELFKGPTEEEKAQGYTSHFSNKTTDILISVTIVNRTAYVNLKDIRTVIPNASASCGSAAFFAEAGETLKHLRTIDKVNYAINGDPEPFYEWMQIGCTPENNNCNKDPFN